MFDCRKMTLDRRSPEPLHIQLAAELRRLIREGMPEFGATLPSERRLCEELELNRSTVHRAYQELIDSGLASRRPDKSLVLSSDARRKLAGAFPAIGVVVPWRFSAYIEQHPSALRYLKGIIDRSAELGYSIFMLQLPEPEAPAAVTNEFMAAHFPKLAGLIHLGDRGVCRDPALQQVLDYRGLPQILISGTSSRPHIGAIFTDFSAAGAELAAEFKAAGCRRIGWISLLSEDESFLRYGPFNYVARQRESGMLKILTDAGLEVIPDWVFKIHSGPTAAADTVTAVGRRRMIPLPDAFWCGNDAMAELLLQALKQNGIRVPDDVAVAGFDGVTPDGRLATVSQPFQQLGTGAIDLLLEHFEYGVNPQNRIRTCPAVFTPGATLKRKIEI